jgi:putative peptidoglycan lipid II flippase
MSAIDLVVRAARGPAALVAALTVFRGVANFALQIALADRFGASSSADVYFIVIGSGVLACEFIAGFLSFAAIPVLIEAKHREGWPYSRAAGVALVWVAALTLLVGAGIVAARASDAIALLAPGMASEASTTATHMLWVALLGFVAYGVALVLGIALQAEERFATTAFVPALPVLGALLTFALAPAPEQLTWLAYGFDLGSFAAVGLQVRAFGGSHSTSGAHGPVLPTLAHIARLAAPVAIAFLCSMLLPLVLRMWATRLGEGNVAAFAFAGQIAALPTAFVVTPVGVVLLPQLAQAVSQQSATSATRLLRQAFAAAVLPTAIIGILLAIFADPLVALAFNRGSFTLEDVSLTAAALRLLGVGLFGVAGSSMLGRSFCASGHVWSFATVWLITLGLVVAAGMFGVMLGSVAELAALYSGAYVFQLSVLALIAARRAAR